MNNYKTWVKILQWNFQLRIDLYGDQMNQISFYKRMRLAPYYFNLIILFLFCMIFLMSKTKYFNFKFDSINTWFSNKNWQYDEMFFYIDNPFVCISCDRWWKI